MKEASLPSNKLLDVQRAGEQKERKILDPYSVTALPLALMFSKSSSSCTMTITIVLSQRMWSGDQGQCHT